DQFVLCSLQPQAYVDQYRGPGTRRARTADRNSDGCGGRLGNEMWLGVAANILASANKRHHATFRAAPSRAPPAAGAATSAPPPAAVAAPPRNLMKSVH